MRLLLATPLYPPDIAEPAPYAKELATRLSPTHEVTILTYGHLPESVEGARIVVVNKRRPLPMRLIMYFFALRRLARNTDVIYALNGPSVELPLFILKIFSSRPLIIRIGDMRAHIQAKSNFWRERLERLAFSRAQAVIEKGPGEKPEILPLEEPPTALLTEYEKSWNEHLTTLGELFYRLHSSNG